MLEQMDINKINPDRFAELIKALEILNKEIMRALQEGKGFIIGGVVEGAGSFPPTVVGLTGGSKQAMEKLRDIFNENNYRLLAAITDIKEKEEMKKLEKIVDEVVAEKKYVNADTIQKDDGSIIINFNK